MNMPAYNPLAGMTSGDQSFGARRPYLLDGDYNLLIERCVIRGRSDPSYLIEVTVMQSNVPERPAGMQCVIFIDIGNADTRGKHLCAFIASCYGIEPTTLPKDSTVTPWDGQQWSGYAMWAVSESNPFANKQIFVNVQTILTQQNKPWTLHTYSPIGTKQIGPRVFGPGFGMQQQQEQQRTAGGPPGAAPGNGFQQPAPQPGAAPAGFAAPAGPPPLGGFAPPAAGAPAGGPPPAGWGPQPSFPAGAPQPGFQGPPQQPQQPQYQQPPQQPQYQQPAQPQYAPAPAPQQAQPQYQQPAPAPQYQQPQQQPQYAAPQQPGQPQFAGPWGGGQR